MFHIKGDLLEGDLSRRPTIAAVHKGHLRSSKDGVTAVAVGDYHVAVLQKATRKSGEKSTDLMVYDLDLGGKI